MNIDDFFYTPLFTALLGSPEANAAFITVNFVLMIVAACAFIGAVGFQLFLIGVRR